LGENPKRLGSRYRGNFEKFLHRYNCDIASPQEITDYMDWKNLVAELADRNVSSRAKKPRRQT
jgi:hypothetical protein